MKHKNRNIQIISIYAVIIAAFLGSTVLFFRIHTSGLRNSIEAETKLFASLLSSTLKKEYPSLEAFEREGAAHLIQTTLEEHESELADLDVRVVSADGMVLAEDSKLHNSINDAALFTPETGASASEGWIGRPEFLLLRKNYYVIRPLYDRSASLIILNYCAEAHALQRSQAAMFIGVMLTLLTIVVVLIANLINNYRNQVIRLATTDELTGLMNRKSFNAEFARFAETSRSQAALFLLDIDFFKQINDSKGHAAGDHALRFLAERIQEMIQKHGGFAGRWGGDEFIGVLHLNGADAISALKELCQNMEASETPDGFRMTISASAADFSPGTGIGDVCERADAALYTAKEHGRNQAVLYETGMMSETVALSESAKPSVSPAAPSASLHTAEPDGSELPESEKVLGREGTVHKRFSEILEIKLIPSILSGVRWMAPFVAGGGILIALAFLFDAASVDLSALSIEARANFGSITPLAAMLKEIGGVTFNFMLPVFAGFMASGLAGDDAFMAGFVGGYMTIESNSGFVGAMIAGLAAGLIANEIQKFTGRLPSFIRKAAPIVIYPVFNLILMQAITAILITPVSAGLGHLFADILARTEQFSEAAAGGLSAMMMAVDMGGIINKVAYNYGVNGLLSNRTKLMASVMIGGMVPPIGIFLSMLYFPDRYTPEEKERGAGVLFMGLSFITEGALPYVFTDPVRVIPCCMAGSAVAGILSMLCGCELPAPHGGIFVFPVMSHAILYAITLFAGSAITGLLLGFIKKTKNQNSANP